MKPVAFLFLLLCACGTVTEPGPVSSFEHVNTGRTGHTTQTGPASGIKATWKTKLGKQISCTPLSGHGLIYVTSQDGIISALDKTTGDIRWQYETFDDPTQKARVMQTTIALYGDRLYAGTWRTRAVALDAMTGNEIWSVPLKSEKTKGHRVPSGIYGAPLVDKDTVYVMIHAGALFALNRHDGTIRWDFYRAHDKRPWVKSTPCMDNERLYYGHYSGQIFAVNRRDGTEAWSFGKPGSGSIAASPSIADGDLIVARAGGLILCLDMNGNQKWSHRVEGKTLGSDRQGPRIMDAACISDDSVVFGSYNGTVTSLDRSNGEVRWRCKVGALVHGGPVVAGNLIYGGTLRNRLFAIDPHTGTIVWSRKTQGYIVRAPLVDDGMLYLGTSQGWVYACEDDSAKSD